MPYQINFPSKLQKILIRIGLLGSFFIVFLYFFFPFHLTKELVLQKLQNTLDANNIPLALEVGVISQNWLTGVKLREVTLTHRIDSEFPIKVKNVTLSLNPFALLLGRLTLSGSIDAGQQGAPESIRYSASLPVFNLIFSGIIRVDNLDLRFNNFEIEPLVYQALNLVRYSTNTNLIFIQPVAKRTYIGGKLNGVVYFSRAKRSSTITLNFNKAFLDFSGNFFGVQKQLFSAAHIEARYDGNVLNILPNTKLVSQDLSLLVSGTIQMNMQLLDEPKDVNLNINLEMRDALKEGFAFLIPQVFGCPFDVLRDGQMQVSLMGKTGGGLNCFAGGG